MSDDAQVRCAKCGSHFACDPAGDCWCKTPPYLPLPGAQATCLCPTCLAEAQAQAARRPDHVADS